MLACVMCGRPAEPTPLGLRLCPECRLKYREFRCNRCGEPVAYLDHPAADRPEYAAGICSLCHVAERVAALTAEDREAITHVAFTRGTVSAVKEMQVRFGWSIREAVTAIELLRDSF